MEKQKNAHSHEEDDLAGDTIDPRRKYKLHCVLEAVITPSKIVETTSRRSFHGDRAKPEVTLAGDTIDPKRKKKQSFFATVITSCRVFETTSTRNVQGCPHSNCDMHALSLATRLRQSAKKGTLCSRVSSTL